MPHFLGCRSFDVFLRAGFFPAEITTNFDPEFSELDQCCNTEVVFVCSLEVRLPVLPFAATKVTLPVCWYLCLKPEFSRF
jgi:hypothetical protein